MNRRLELIREARARYGPVAALVAACLLVGYVLQRDARLSRQIDDLRGSVAARPAGRPDTAQAISKGQAAIRDGRWELGQVYLVNAITNAPGDVGCLGAYADAVLGNNDAPDDAIDRLSSMLQLAAYQVGPDDVPKVMAFVERAEQARRRGADDAGAGPGEPAGAAKPDEAPDPKARWAALSAVDPAAWKDPARLKAHLDDLEDFLSDLDERGEAPGPLRAEASAALVRWSTIDQAARQSAYVDACLDRLDRGEDLSSRRAVSIVQAAENALPAFWGIDPKALPDDLARKLDAYPARVEALVKKIGDAASASTLDRIKEVLATNPEQAGGSWETICGKLESQVKEAQKLAAKLTSTDAVLAVQGLVARKSDAIRECRNKQYHKYQVWAIQQCNAAFDEYMTYRTGASEKDARDLFKKHELAAIDQSLLSPEVSRVFNDVYGKLAGEMNPEALVTTEKEMGTSKKVKLENF